VTVYQTQADPTKVMGRRIVAFIIDLALVWVLLFAVFGATVDTETVAFNPCEDPLDDGAQICNVDDIIVVWDGDEATLFEFGDTTIVNLVGFVYWVLVFCVWQGLAGMTPGKALLGVRTVNEQGDAPGIGRALIRGLLMIVDSFCCYLVGLISAGTTKGHRRIGDMAAKTFVVGKDAMGSPIAVPGLTPPGAAFGAAGPYAQATPASWEPPPATGAPTAAAPTGAGEPQWDEARQAYIQWDPAQQVWLQFDQATQQWRPIQ
jgi:uncharacterized RDD family membrane protein YckC